MKKKLLWLAVAAALAVCAVIGAVIVSAAETDPAASDTTEWTEVANYTFDEGKADKGLTEVGENFTYADGAVTLGEKSYFEAQFKVQHMDAMKIEFTIKIDPETTDNAWVYDITSQDKHESDQGTIGAEHYLGALAYSKSYWNTESDCLRVERYANTLNAYRPEYFEEDVDLSTGSVKVTVIYGDDGSTSVSFDGGEPIVVKQSPSFQLSINDCIGENPKMYIGFAPWYEGEYAEGLTIYDIAVYGHIVTEKEFNGVVGDVDASGNLLLNVNNFPDETFRTYIAENFDTDSGGVLSADEIAAVTAIDVGQMWNVSSLKGIEYFAELTELYAGNNRLSELDVTHNTKLTYLDVGSNSLTELDVSKNADLKNLSCSYNNIEELDVSQNAVLTYLGCYENELTSLKLPVSVTDLSIDGNHLTQLTVPEGFKLNIDSAYVYYQTALEPVVITKTTEGKYRVDLSGFVDDASKIGIMYSAITDEWGTEISDGIFEFTDDPLSIKYYYEVCSTAQLRVTVDTDMDESGAEYLPIDEEHFPDANFREYLKGLDVVEDPELGFTPRELEKVTEISCNYWDIKDFEGLELFPNLTRFTVYGNPLESLVMPECEKLTSVSVNYCELKSLDVSKLTNLLYLYCNDNELTKLDVSKLENLLYLDCSNNDLTTLDLSHNTALYGIRCNNNKLAYVDISNTDVIETAGNSYFANVSAQNQTLDKTVVVTEEDGEYTLDFRYVVGSRAAAETVQVVSPDGEMNSRGIYTFKSKPTSIEYKIVLCTDRGGNEIAMTVTASNIDIEFVNTEAVADPVPAETTAAPAETTAAPADTTAAPADTTAAPAETTATPAETTATPADTTAAPAETTAAPAETTAAPAVTTEAPSTGSTAEPPATGDSTGFLPALIVTMMCVGVAGVAVFTCSKKRR